MEFNSYNQVECDYFNLYNQFLRVDFKISLVEGRNRELIKDFMFFYHQILKKEKLASLISSRNKIALKLKDYAAKHKVSLEHLNICTFYNKHIEGFNIFYKAVAIFVNFRQQLNEKQKMSIAQANIKQRFNYHFIIKNFNSIDDFCKQYEPNNILTVPRQCLNDFHNAMTHLCILYLKPTNKKYTEENLNKVLEYLKHATFNAYKTILRDYFLLHPHDESIKLELVEIKELEYKFMYGEKQIEEYMIFDAYKKICAQILQKLNTSI